MEPHELIKERLAPLAPIITPNLPQARRLATTALDLYGTSRTQAAKMYADLFNFGLRGIIHDSDLGQWELTGAPNGIHLHDKETHLDARILKEYAFSGTVPPAGPNKARNAAWTQGTLELPGTAHGPHPLEGTTMIIVWAEVDGLFRCDAYLPSGAGRFPNGAPTTLAIPMTADTTGYDDMRFDMTEPTQRFITPTANTIVERHTEATATKEA